jgi:hypothetical protein
VDFSLFFLGCLETLFSLFVGDFLVNLKEP